MLDLLIWVFWALCALGAAALGLSLVVWFVAVFWYWLIAALVLFAGVLAWPWLQTFSLEDWAVLAAVLAVWAALSVDASRLK